MDRLLGAAIDADSAIMGMRPRKHGGAVVDTEYLGFLRMGIAIAAGSDARIR